MPRAGWCRECGAWIWLDAAEACPAGHGPECVTNHYEAMPAAPVAVRDGIGVGEMPAVMHRFNWGAFFLPGVWALVYGVWPLIWIWLATAVLPLVLGFAVGLVYAVQGGTIQLSGLIGVTVISDVFIAFSRLWIGANANRLYWLRESTRLRGATMPFSTTSVQRFLGRQGRWMVWGAVGTGLASAMVMPAAVRTWQPYGLEWAAFAEPAVWLAASIVLGIWLAGRMRIENPDDTTAPEGTA